MGETRYYLVYVKIRNQSEPLPDTSVGAPSPLSPVFEYRFFVKDEEILEKRLDFSFEEVSFEGKETRVTRLLINDNYVNIDKSAIWDDYNSGYYYQFFLELWVYDLTTSTYQFNNRYIQFWINMTRQV